MIKDLILDTAAFGLFIVAVYIAHFITPTTTHQEETINGHQEHTYQQHEPITRNAD